MKMNRDLRVAVAQLGFRMHYGVPMILHTAGMLDTLYTDLYFGKWPWKSLADSWMRRILPVKLRVLMARKAVLPSEKVRAFQRYGAAYLWRTKKARPTERWRIHLWAGEEFNRLIIEEGLGDANCVYGFPGQCLRLFEHASEHDVLRVLDQCCAPVPVEDSIVRPEYDRWPGWEEPPAVECVIAGAARQRLEWNLADLILCPSEFVGSGLEAMGVPSKKCSVVPYGVRIDGTLLPRRTLLSSRPIRVLFVGQVRLLKGVPYLLDAMRQFKASEAVCHIVGPIKVSREKLESYAPPNVSVCGPVPRTELEKHYAWADIFCLPTLCEGSATVVYEALVRGLPVVTTPNCGSIIRSSDDSRNIIVPIRDASAIAGAIRTIATRTQKATDLPEALQLAKAASLESYSTRLTAALVTLQLNS